jgi:hypothetical protein
MPLDLYKNKRSQRYVILVKVNNNMYKVEYVISKQRSWFREDDFNRIFVKAN